jgi:hypothetical protein
MEMIDKLSVIILEKQIAMKKELSKPTKVDLGLGERYNQRLQDYKDTKKEEELIE